MSRLQSDLFYGQLRPSRCRVTVILALVFLALILFVGSTVGADWDAASVWASNRPNENVSMTAAQTAAATEVITPYRDLVLVLDRSSSMALEGAEKDPVLCNATQSCHPFEDVRNSAVWLVSQLNFPYDRVALVGFSRRVLVYDPAVGYFRQLTANELVTTTLMITDKIVAMNALSNNVVFNIDTCVHFRGCYDNDMPGLDYMASSNIGGAIRVATNILTAQGRLSDTTWMMLLATDGNANATDPVGQFTGGFCPPTTWAYGATYTVPGYLPNQVSLFPYAYPYCRRANVSPGSPPTGDPDLPYSQLTRVCLYTPLRACPPGTTITDTIGYQYDAADYMRDQADYMASEGIVAFVVGVGHRVIDSDSNQSTTWNCTPIPGVQDCSRERNAGERLLRYVADMGTRPNTWLCHSNYWTPGQTELPRGAQCGNYWYAATSSDLPPIFAAIVDRTNLPGPPLAAFTASPLSGALPLTVYFTDTSTGAVSSWLWDFGDGVTSTLQHPTHTYTASGAFTVALQVSGPGGSDMVTRTDYIMVHRPVTADFIASPLSGLPPLTVYFTDTSTGAVSSWLWDFGDGVTGTLQHPTHTYHLTGTFDVTLTVTGLGGSDVEAKTAYISVMDGYVVYLPIVSK